MTPTPTPPSTGSPKTTLAGVLGLLAGLAGIFVQIYGAMHGQPVNVPTTVASIGLIAHAGGLVAAQDQK